MLLVVLFIYFGRRTTAESFPGRFTVCLVCAKTWQFAMINKNNMTTG